MRGLLKIYGKYIGIVWVGFLFLLIGNMMVGIWMLTDRMALNNGGILEGIGNLEEQIFEENGSLSMKEDGEDCLSERQIVFLMILDEQGNVIYEWNLPEGFKEHYSLGEVAAFSKWYLHDYPVKVWRGERGLLVAGAEKNSLWKYNVEFSMDFMLNIGRYLKIFGMVNLLIILLFVFWLGYRYYCSLKPLSEGIERLASNRRIALPEKGVTQQLAASLNQTSDILEKQREALSRRDMARTEWIAGVSHDIRTPLSVIVGYAQELEENPGLSEADHKKAEIMKNQSLRISRLIEDLNLTSKLAYHMQPLRQERFYPASLLRMLAAERINEGLEERYELMLQLAPELESRQFCGDRELLARALRNLLNNSIRHNPQGCHITLSGSAEAAGPVTGREASDHAGSREAAVLVLAVEDDGKGIPAGICRELMGRGHEEGAEEECRPHIMGLNIVRQITLAHGGEFEILQEGHLVNLKIPWVKE